MGQASECRARRDLEHLAAFGARQRQRRCRPDDGQAEVGDAAVAVVEGERGPGAGAAIGGGFLIDFVPRVAIVIEAVMVIQLRRMLIGVVRVRMVVGSGGVVAVEVDRQGKRGAVGSVSVVGAVTRQVAHWRHDPAEHERGELGDGGLATRGHARGNATPDRGRCPAP